MSLVARDNPRLLKSQQIHNKTGTDHPSQILELLLEVNESQKAPPHTRYDLSSPPPSVTDLPELSRSDSEPLEEVHDAQLALREARHEYESGILDRGSYTATESQLLHIMSQGRKLRNLHCTVHTRPDNGEGVERTRELYPELWEDDAVGFLSPTHAESFAKQYDEYLERDLGVDDPYLPTMGRRGEREREREGMLHNPMSVYNWLSTHRPREMVAAAEEEEVKGSLSRKSPPKQGGGGSVMGVGAAPVGGKSSKKGGGGLKEEEMLDEEGYVVGGELGADEGGIGGAGAGAKKRKRGVGGEDDGSYRPKGGGGKKRKRASTKGGEGGG